MLDALRSEWLKLMTLRSTKILLAASVLANMIIPVILLIVSDGDPLNSRDGATLVTGGIGVVPQLPPLPAILLGLVGAFCIGHEYRYGTIIPSLLATPARSTLVVSKLIVCVAIAAATAGLSLGVNTALVFAFNGEPVPLGRQEGVIAGFFGLMIGWTLLGFGLTMLLRKTLPAVAFLFVMTFVVENVVRALGALEALSTFESISRFLPFSAGTLLAQPVGQPIVGAMEPLSRIEHAAIFGAFCVVAVALGWTRMLRSDA